MKRGTRSRLLERSGNGFCGKQIQHRNLKKRISHKHVLGRTFTRTILYCHQKLGTSHYRPQQENSGYICSRRARSVGLIHEDMNAENSVLLQAIPQGCNVEKGQG